MSFDTQCGMKLELVLVFVLENLVKVPGTYLS